MDRVQVALVLLLFVFILFSAIGNAAPPPRVCGDGQCQDPETCSSCSADCGACPAETTTTTTTAEGGPVPVTVSIESPQDGQIIKRGGLILIVKGFSGISPESDLKVIAVSDLFGEVSLKNDFEQRGIGMYGVNVTVGKEIKAGKYVILVRGEGDSAADEHQILISLDPTITIDASIEDSYFKGERIFFEGKTKYFNGSLATNASLEIALFAPGDYRFNLSAASDQNGKFAVSYPISFAEPEGKWDIRITARDKDGNEGSTILKTKVSTPKGVVFYTVKFLSPFKDAEFKRGSAVPITVEVKDEDRLLEKATVEFKDQHGEFLPLKEVSPGVYSAENILHLHPHEAVWQIPVQALKTVDGVTKAGGNRISVKLLPATLNLVLLQPTAFDFFAGQQVTLQAKATYSDDSAVEKAKVLVKIGDETIILTETEPSIYENTYIFSAKYLATTELAYSPDKKITTASLELYAEDVHGNSLSAPQRAITVKEVSKAELKVRLFYYNILARFRYLFVSGFLFLVLVTSPLWHAYYLQARLNSIAEAEKRGLEVQKEIQRKYFKHHSINREDYDKLMLKYREQSSSMREKKLKIHQKLGKKSKMQIQ